MARARTASETTVQGYRCHNLVRGRVCGHTWHRRAAGEAQWCVRCKRRPPRGTKFARVTLPAHRCPRCGYVWVSTDGRPDRCAGCKDPRWDQPRQWRRRPSGRG